MSWPLGKVDVGFSHSFEQFCILCQTTYKKLQRILRKHTFALPFARIVQCLDKCHRPTYVVTCYLNTIAWAF